jgi:hypothetical protein
MTKQTARNLANLEQSLYDKWIAAGNEHTIREDSAQGEKDRAAWREWRKVLRILRKAQVHYPCLFAPFVSYQTRKV